MSPNQLLEATIHSAFNNVIKARAIARLHALAPIPLLYPSGVWRELRIHGRGQVVFIDKDMDIAKARTLALLATTTIHKNPSYLPSIFHPGLWEVTPGLADRRKK